MNRIKCGRGLSSREADANRKIKIGERSWNVDRLWSTYLNLLLGHILGLMVVSIACEETTSVRAYLVAHDDLAVTPCRHSGARWCRLCALGRLGRRCALCDTSSRGSGGLPGKSTATATTSTATATGDLIEALVQLGRHDGMGEMCEIARRTVCDGWSELLMRLERRAERSFDVTLWYRDSFKVMYSE